MIAELRVRDLATVADVTLDLGDGLNVLTGETGAGKSMLVDALALLLGERADSATVRSGSRKAVVEGVVDRVTPAVLRRLEALGLDVVDDHLIIRREVSVEGRSRAWINGSPCTMSTLASVGELLVDLHGQHETQSLLKPAEQRQILDSWSGAEADAEAVRAAHAGLQELRESETALVQRRDEIRRRADYLRHVVHEIDAAQLVAGEDEALTLEARRLSQAGALSEFARRVLDAVDEGEASASHALGEAERALAQLERSDPSVADWRALLDAAFDNVRELGRLAAGYTEDVQEDPARLDQVERRRDLLATLQQKYGSSLDAVRQARVEAAAELDLLDTADLDLRSLAARRAAAEQAFLAAAKALSARRAEGAERLGRAVSRLLPRLGLKGGRITVQLVPLTTPAANGAESVEFHAQLNQGLDARPLARSASGGELSRLMLALKVVLAHHDRVPTLVFDEVDQGIGGEVGAQVGAALAELGERRQVLVITHLPQIAARGDRHLVVSKEPRGGVATSDVTRLHGEDRVAELARMLGDPDGETARRHAQALLADARKLTGRS
jgi:DNA repair protein RecN (Recombination protein N)